MLYTDDGAEAFESPVAKASVSVAFMDETYICLDVRTLPLEMSPRGVPYRYLCRLKLAHAADFLRELGEAIESALPREESTPG